MRKLIASCLLFVLALTANADQLASGILYGKDWALIVKAPDGWVMDDQAWAQSGIYAVFYQEGKHPVAPNAVIYVNSTSLPETSEAAYGAYVDQDIANTKAGGGTSVVEQPSHQTKANSAARVVIFSYPGKGQYEEIVYLWYKGVVHLVVLTTRDFEELQSLEPKLFEVVDSISFMDKK